MHRLGTSSSSSSFSSFVFKPASYFSSSYKPFFQLQHHHQYPSRFLVPTLFQRHLLTTSPSSTLQPSKMATTDATLRTFFQSPKFAVVGASTNPEKYGYKVFRWYLHHSLPVTPVNPSGAAITVDGTPYQAVKSLSEIENAPETAVSFITPPPVTLKSLQQAKELGFPSVFLQPGTFDDEVLEYARANFKAVVAGTEGETRGSEGWCVLVDGERGLRGVGKL